MSTRNEKEKEYVTDSMPLDIPGETEDEKEERINSFVQENLSSFFQVVDNRGIFGDKNDDLVVPENPGEEDEDEVKEKHKQEEGKVRCN